MILHIKQRHLRDEALHNHFETLITIKRLAYGASRVSVRHIIEGRVVGSRNVSWVNLVSKDQQSVKIICMVEFSINFPSLLRLNIKENYWEETFSTSWLRFLLPGLLFPGPYGTATLL